MTVPATLLRADTMFLAPGFQRGFNVTAYNERGFSGPGGRRAMQRLAAAGMIPVLKPHVDVQDGTFRGLIRPDDYDTWFAAYRRMLLQYATIAQRAGAPLLVIGDELTGVQGDRQRWPPLIAAVRRLYKGKLTYAANWDPGYKPSRSGTSWSTSDRQLPPAEDRGGEPLGAGDRGGTGAGGRGSEGGGQGDGQTGAPDRDRAPGPPQRAGQPGRGEQRRARRPGAAGPRLRGRLRVLRPLPFVAGIYWWDWGTDSRADQPNGGPGSYVPTGKPAEQVVRAFSR